MSIPASWSSWRTKGSLSPRASSSTKNLNTLSKSAGLVSWSARCFTAKATVERCSHLSFWSLELLITKPNRSNVGGGGFFLSWYSFTSNSMLSETVSPIFLTASAQALATARRNSESVWRKKLMSCLGPSCGT